MHVAKKTQWVVKGEAKESLRILVDLRVSRALSLASDRPNETHQRLLEAVGEFQRKINLQEKQVALDRAYFEMKQRAYDTFGDTLGKSGGIVTSLDRWAGAVTKKDCSYNLAKARTRDP